jgi:hypothetical protein
MSIQAKDLRVNNWVLWGEDKKPMQVIGLRAETMGFSPSIVLENSITSDVEGMPITKVIVEQMGAKRLIRFVDKTWQIFIQKDKEPTIVIYVQFPYFSESVEVSVFADAGEIQFKHIQFAHQLQNLYSMLSGGQEITIKKQDQ